MKGGVYERWFYKIETNLVYSNQLVLKGEKDVTNN